MQQNTPIIHKRGDALSIIFNVEGLDFTGLSVKSMFKKRADQTTPDLLFSTTDGSITVNVIDATHATLTFTKTAVEMADIPVGTYGYDIITFTGPTDEFTFCEGPFQITKDYTTT